MWSDKCTPSFPKQLYPPSFAWQNIDICLQMHIVAITSTPRCWHSDQLHQGPYSLLRLELKAKLVQVT